MAASSDRNEIEVGVEQSAIVDGVDQAAIVDGVDQAAILKSLKQYYIPCAAEDKFVHILALLKNNLVQKKALIFTNTAGMAFKLKVFLDKFAMNVAVLNPELYQPHRMHIVREFNAGSFDYLIAIYDGSTASDEYAEEHWMRMLGAQFGVVSGSELQNVKAVINFQMPLTAVGYMHRIGFAGEESDTQASFLLVSPDEMQRFEELKSTLAIYKSGEKEFIVPFHLLTEDMVESLRYQAEDIERSVTEDDVFAAEQPLVPVKHTKKAKKAKHG